MFYRYHHEKKLKFTGRLENFFSKVIAKQREKTINYLLLLISMVFLLSIMELGIRIFELDKKEIKVPIGVRNECLGHCYSSDKRRLFPINLRTIKDEDLFEKYSIVESAEKLKELREQTPYCVTYDCQRRKDGYFPKRQKEVAIIGDSFVFGEGVKEEDTLGYVLDMEFENTNFRNFGKAGMNIWGIFDIASGVIASQKFKEAVYFYNLNDLSVCPVIAGQQKFIIDFELVKWENVPKKQSMLTMILSKSSIYNLLMQAFIINKESRLTIKNYSDMYFSPENKHDLEKSIEMLVALNDLAKKNGCHFCIVIYPLIYKDIFGRYPFAPIHNFLKKICQERGIRCIDAYPAFQEYYSLRKFTVNPIDFHPNGQANRLVARYLAKEKIWH